MLMCKRRRNSGAVMGGAPASNIRIQTGTPNVVVPQEPALAPEETCRVARAPFSTGALCLRIADALRAI